MSDENILDLPPILLKMRDQQRAVEAAKAKKAAEAQGARDALGVRTIQQRLLDKFGLGDDPRKRRALYDRLAKLEAEYHEVIMDCISEAVAESVGARHPDRYFCRAIRAKIRHLGLAAGGDGSW